MNTSIQTLDVNERVETLQAQTREFVKHRQGELIFEFNSEADPEKIVKFVEWANDHYKLTLTVAHAELRDYIRRALMGGLIGGGIMLLARVLFPWFLSGSLIAGALLGAWVGAVSAAIHIKIYKFNGRTRIKIQQE